MQSNLYRIRNFIFTFGLLMLGFGAKAQLTIEDNVTAAQLVDKLVGSGVITLNPSLTCKAGGAGIFEGVSNLGLDSGIVLTTAAAKTANGNIGVNAAANQGMLSLGGMAAGDADLSAMLAGSTSTVTNNACVLEFKFVPAGDTVKFEYVFGSEEYPEFACSQYNDVFGFLISGPGIVSNVAGLPTKRNIALVPGQGNTPVAINSINSGVGGYPVSNCSSQYPGGPFTAFYVDNLNPVGQHVVFDGFTTVLTAIQNVVPCDTYTLKLAVADVADGSLNSGVFIKAGSLNSVGLISGAQGMNVTVSDTAFVVRGCPSADVTITRQSASPLPLAVPYVLEGTAINGVDYETLSGTVIIPPDSTVGRIKLKPLPVPVTGPNKIAIIKFLSPYSCGANPVVVDSAIVSIQDSILISTNFNRDTAICLGQQLDIEFVTDTIYGPLSWEWVPATGVVSNTIDYSSINLNAAGHYTYQYKVRIPSQDTNCRASTATFNIEVQDIAVNIGDDTSICSYDRLQMFAEVNPQDDGSGLYAYNWYPPEIFNNPNTVAPYIKENSTSTDVVLVVRTDIGCIGRDTIRLTVNPGEFADVLPSDTAICPNEVVTPRIYSTLANTPLNPNYEYFWSPTFRMENPNSAVQNLSPETSTKYLLRVRNEFGCIDSSYVDIVVKPAAVAAVPDSVVLWLGESYQMEPYTNALNFSWFPVSGISNANISNPVFSPEVDTRYFYTAITEDGCKLVDSIDFRVRTEGVFNMPNAFNPNNTTFKPVFRGNFTLESFEIYDRWGAQVFSSKDMHTGWDGSFKAAPAPLGVYVYAIKLKNNTSNKIVQQTGSVTLVR
jgi:gliding motility-associated-like protein